MWTESVRERAVRALPAGEAPPRPPARVRLLVDLRVRRGHDRGPDSRRGLSGMILGLKGPAWWRVSGGREVLQQRPPLGRGGLLLRHGRPPVGKFFMGAWRGGRGLTWVTDAGVVPPGRPLKAQDHAGADHNNQRGDRRDAEDVDRGDVGGLPVGQQLVGQAPTARVRTLSVHMRFSPAAGFSAAGLTPRSPASGRGARSRG